MYKIYILLFCSAALLFSCQSKSEEAETKPKTEKAASKKPEKKTKKADTKKKRDYWVTLSKRVKIGENQIAELKKLDAERRVELKKSKNRNELRKSYEEKERSILGGDLYTRKSKFDYNWNNPLSYLNLVYELKLNQDQRKSVNQIMDKYKKDWVNGKKGLSSEKSGELKEQLVAQKLEDLKAVLSQEQIDQVNSIMANTNVNKIKGIYPF